MNQKTLLETSEDVTIRVHLEGAGQGGHVGLQLPGADDLPFSLQRREPDSEVVADGDHAAGGGLGLAGTHLNDLPIQIRRFSVEPFQFGHADPGKVTDGENRHQIGRGMVQELGHFLGGEDRRILGFHAHPLHLLDGIGLLIGQVVLSLGEGEERLDAS